MKILVITGDILLVGYIIVQLFAFKSQHKIKGWANDKKNEQYKNQLIPTLKNQGIQYLNKFKLFGYNVPYEVFNRRNEIILKLKQNF